MRLLGLFLLLPGLIISSIAGADVSQSSDFIGHWATDCVSEGDSHLTSQLDIQANQIEVRMQRFSDDGCQNLLAEAVIRGGYTLTGESALVAGAKDLNLQLQSAEVTPATGFAALGMNAEGLCGIDGWRAHQPMDVSGHNCGTGLNVPAKGTPMYYLVKLDQGTRLYIGKFTDEKDGSTADKRPDELDSDVVFSRQYFL